VFRFRITYFVIVVDVYITSFFLCEFKNAKLKTVPWN